MEYRFQLEQKYHGLVPDGNEYIPYRFQMDQNTQNTGSRWIGNTPYWFHMQYTILVPYAIQYIMIWVPAGTKTSCTGSRWDQEYAILLPVGIEYPTYLFHMDPCIIFIYIKINIKLILKN